MIQVQNIGTRVVDDLTQIFFGGVKILLAFLHPVEAKCGGMIFEAVQALHPGGLIGKRDFSKADERDLGALGYEAGDEFTCIRPNAAERVRGH
jgi:hypothetical protein